MRPMASASDDTPLRRARVLERVRVDIERAE
jgi:hypothetical protein